jgi:CRISPR-associated protein Cmr4
MNNCKMLWIHALTPVHVGCGFGVGAVDLPVVREKVTNWPMLPGSGLKGVLADYHQASVPDERKDLARCAFGRPDGKGGDQQISSNAGALVLGDARLVLLPVRSLFGTWAWVTCPMALRRLLRDLETTGLADGTTVANIVPAGQQILLPRDCVSKIKKQAATVYLADLDLTGVADPSAKAWAEKFAAWLFPHKADQPVSPWVAEFVARFGIVHDDLFNYLVETGVEVVTRIRVDPSTGTVAKGQLWTEEALPAESILASLVWVDKVRTPGSTVTEADILKAYCEGEFALQVGGKATIGHGRVRAVFNSH